MMNVLIVSEPGEGGVFAYVESLCVFLMDQGIAVHLAYSDVRGSDRLTRLVERVRAAGGQAVNLEVGNAVQWSDFRGFLRLWRLVERVRPDVVHCHSSKAGVLGRSLALMGVRSSFIYHPHAYYGMRPTRRSRDRIYDLIETFFGRIGTTVTVSNDERHLGMNRLRLPADRLELVHNGVDTGRFCPTTPERRRSLRAAFGLPEAAKVLGSISRLSAQKDPITLYKAFGAACATDPDIHLFHVGNGDLEGEVNALIGRLGIASRVTRLSYLSDPQGFYQAIDGLALTSIYEGLSLAALEALATDLPLILSRAPGNMDLIGLPLDKAWTAAPGDVAEFTRCIGLWSDRLDHPAPSNHRAFALSHFEGTKAREKVVRVYRETAARPPDRLPVWTARLPLIVFLGVIAFESTALFTRANTREMLYPLFHFLTRVSYDDFYEWNHYVRKAGHVVGYGVLSLLFYRLAIYEIPAALQRAKPYLSFAAAFAATAAVAVLDEWHQTFVPGRTGTVADVLLDSAAAALALAAMAAVSFLVLRWQSGEDTLPPPSIAPQAGSAE